MTKPTDEKMEIWKDVIGYEGKYKVSNHGNVMSLLNKGRMLHKSFNPKGYHRVCLSSNNKIKMHSVQKLVLEAFHSIRPSGLQAAHLDGNRTNNHLSNLKWVTCKENHYHRDYVHGNHIRGERNGSSILKESQVVEILKLHKLGMTQKSIAEAYKVHPGTISKIITGECWSKVEAIRNAMALEKKGDR
jgi:hypothetical protein